MKKQGDLPEKPHIITGGFREEAPENSRGSRKQKTEKGKKSSPAYIIIFCASVLLFLAGAIGLISFACRCGKTNEDNEKYRQLHSAAVETPLASESPYDAETPVPVCTQEPAPSPTAVPETPSPSAEVISSAVTPVPSVTFRPSYFDLLSPMLPEMSELYRVNSDIAGWLQIPGVVDLPVVYKDNDYYLHRNLEKKQSDAGTLFLDERCPIFSGTQYLLVHGHNMKDGTMFAPVIHYKTKGLPFLKTHPFAQFSTLHQTDSYVIFAVCHVSLDYQSGRYIPYYGFSSFDTEEEFDDFIKLLKSQSLYSIPIDVDASDSILVLSTCLNDDRIIACFRRVRPYEWTSELNSLINKSTEK